MKTGYNGWTNYNTWNIALWINNDEPTYRCFENFKKTEPDVSGLRYWVADIFDGETPDGVKADSDDINWNELYKNMVGDLG